MRCGWKMRRMYETSRDKKDGCIKVIIKSN